MPDEGNAFEATARRVTHDWMRHLGYTDDKIEKAESMTCEQAGCQMFGEGQWDHWDENGDPLHPERDELDEASEFVAFVLEHPVVARDDTAELVRALEACITAIQSLPEDALGRDPSEGWPHRDELLYHVRAALARYRGEL